MLCHQIKFVQVTRKNIGVKTYKYETWSEAFNRTLTENPNAEFLNAIQLGDHKFLVLKTGGV